MKSLLEMDDKLGTLRSKMTLYNDEVQALTAKVKAKEQQKLEQLTLLREQETTLEEARMQAHEKEQQKDRLRQQMLERRDEANELEQKCIQVHSRVIDLKRKLGVEEVLLLDLQTKASKLTRSAYQDLFKGERLPPSCSIYFTRIIVSDGRRVAASVSARAAHHRRYQRRAARHRRERSGRPQGQKPQGNGGLPPTGVVAAPAGCWQEGAPG